MQAIFAIALGLFGFIGWALNIYQMLTLHNEFWFFLVRLVGVFMFPLGAAMGWLGVFFG
jgi:hypothetical protein